MNPAAQVSVCSVHTATSFAVKGGSRTVPLLHVVSLLHSIPHHPTSAGVKDGAISRDWWQCEFGQLQNALCVRELGSRLKSGPIFVGAPVPIFIPQKRPEADAVIMIKRRFRWRHSHFRVGKADGPACYGDILDRKNSPSHTQAGKDWQALSETAGLKILEKLIVKIHNPGPKRTKQLSSTSVPTRVGLTFWS